MMVLVTYDVNTTTKEGRRRLRLVAKECVNYGQRVQNSVFECMLDPVKLLMIQKKLGDIIDIQHDSIRYYNLGANWKNRVEHVGTKVTYDPEGIIII